MKLEKPVVVPGSGGGKGSFLKIEDGKSVVGVFRGEPFTWKCKWDGKTYAEDPEGYNRYKWNFVMKEGNHFVSKIFEFAGYLYETIFEINEIQPIESQWIKITRKGTGTKTNYIILPVGIVGQKELEVAKVELQLLGAQKHTEIPMPNAGDAPPEEKLPWED